MKQNTRKNQTNQELNMPTAAYYTLRQLFDLNKHIPAEITIRVKHSRKIENREVAELGTQTGGKGRPQKVFAITPITPTLIARAKADHINLVDNADKLVTVLSVSSKQNVSGAAIVPNTSHVLAK